MTSALRELIWLEIQQNPGSTVAQIEKALGKEPNTGVSSYTTDLYRAGKIRRVQLTKACNNFARQVLFFSYYVIGKEYTWKVRKNRKPTKAAALKTEKKDLTPTKPRKIAQAAQTAIHQAAKTDQVEPWITQLPNLPVKDVMKLHKAIDAVFTA